MTEELPVCSVCLQEQSLEETALIQLTCHHTFHFDCLRECAAFDNRCPMCRQTTIPDFGYEREDNSLPVITFPLTPELLRALATENLFSSLIHSSTSTSDNDNDDFEME